MEAEGSLWTEVTVQRAQALRIAAHALLTATVTTTCEAADSCGSENGNAWRARTALQSAVTHALDEAESIIKLLAQRRDPSPEMCAHFIVSSMDAISALLLRVNNLELEVEEQGSEIARLELQVMQMQQQLDELRGDSDSQLFRELATQSVSKIARKATGCTVWEARFTPLCILKHGRGAAVYRSIVQRYPLLKAAAQAACSQSRPVAHPVPVPLPVTEQSLRALIKHGVAAPVRPATEQLLACLMELTTDFNEPLFVAAAPPS